MMLPDTKVATMKQVLNLSITGQVVVADQAMMDEVMSLVNSLGFKAMLSREITMAQDMSDQDNLAELEAQPVDECYGNMSVDGTSVETMDGDNIDDNEVEICNVSKGLIGGADKRSSSTDSLKPRDPLTTQSSNNSHNFDKVISNTEQQSEDMVSPLEVACSDETLCHSVDISDSKESIIENNNSRTTPSYLNEELSRTENDGLANNDFVFVDELGGCANSQKVDKNGINEKRFPSLFSDNINDGAEMATGENPADFNIDDGLNLSENNKVFSTSSLLNNSRSHLGTHQKPITIKISKDVTAESNRQIQCSICKRNFETFRKFVVHLTRTHYVKKLMSLFGQDKSTCPLCRHKFPEGSKKRDKTEHLGMAHKKIFALSNQAVKAQDKYKSKRSSGKSGDYMCPLCGIFFGTKSNVKVHLARVHFKDEILKMANISNNCKRCPECRLSKKSYKSYEIVSHLGSDKHGYLDKILPDSIKNALTAMNNKQSKISKTETIMETSKSVERGGDVTANESENESESGPGKPKKGAQESHKPVSSGSTKSHLHIVLPANIQEDLDETKQNNLEIDDVMRYEKANIVHLKSSKKEKNDKLTKSASLLSCPSCPLKYDRRSHLFAHLATSHYRKMVFAEANVPCIPQIVSKECPLCHKTVGYMSRHLGVTHGYLRKVMPPGDRKKVFGS